MEKILVVDDDAKVLRLTGEILEGRGYGVTLTESPEEALKILKTDPHQFNVILLDWKLRCVIDGDMVVKMIQHAFPDFKTPIIFITAHTKISSKYLMRLGAYDTLLKPVTTDQLMDAIERALGKKEPEDPHYNAPVQINVNQLKKQQLVKRIIEAVSETGSLRDASKKLGCSRASLYRWLQKTGLYSFYVGKEP